MISAPPPAQTAAAPEQMDDAKLLTRKILMQLGILLAITFFGVLTTITFNEQVDNWMPEQETFPSVFNHKSSGVSGAAEVFSKAGFTTKEWVLPYRQLSTISGTLLLIAPSESPSDFEVAQILNWVNAGNNLIFLDDFGMKLARRLPSKAGVEGKDGIQIRDKQLQPAKPELPVFNHVKSLTISADSRMTGAPPLISDDSGGLLTEIKYGKGTILLGTAPSLLSNRRLGNPDSWSNFQFVANWLSRTKGEVWFDERCHGFSSNSNVFFYLLRGPAGLALAQLLLVAAVGIYSASQRFGRTEALNSRRKISSLEYINGLANTYSRAKANGASLEIIAQSFRTKLCKAISISPHDSNEQLQVAVKTSALLPAGLKEAIDKFLTDYDLALSRPNLPDSELKALIIRCDKITEQLTQTITQNKLTLAGATETVNR